MDIIEYVYVVSMDLQFDSQSRANASPIHFSLSMLAKIEFLWSLVGLKERKRARFELLRAIWDYIESLDRSKSSDHEIS